MLERRRGEREERLRGEDVSWIWPVYVLSETGQRCKQQKINNGRYENFILIIESSCLVYMALGLDLPLRKLLDSLISMGLPCQQHQVRKDLGKKELFWILALSLTSNINELKGFNTS